MTSFPIPSTSPSSASSATTALFKAMFAGSLDAVLLTRCGDGIVAANPAACDLLGYDEAELLRIGRAALVGTGETKIANFMALRINDTAARGAMVFTRKDKSTFAAEVTSTPFRDEQGVTFATIFLRDISISVTDEPSLMADMLVELRQRRSAEQALKSLNAELEEKIRQRNSELDQAKRELESFSYSISHDLRGPLNVIGGFTQLMAAESAGELPEKSRNYLQHINTATQRMQGLIEDILRLSRVSRAELKRERLDLSAMAHEIVKALREKDPARRVEVLIDAGLHADADATLLRVVLENLLGNAWKFSSKRDDAQIAFRKHGPDGFLVQDNGVGFAMKDAERMFRGFQRLHADKEFKGTGIGLNTVQRVVQRHGGQVWAEGAPGAGATLFFRLPARA